MSHSTQRLTTQQFITKAQIVHSHKYDYSLVEYTNNRVKVKIICPTHGIFEQRPNTHLNGAGCKQCSEIQRHISKKKPIDEFIDRANKIHNFKYDYSKSVLMNFNSKINITCPIHGDFIQSVKNHFHYGCAKCGGRKKWTLEEFIDESIKVHGDKYEYHNTQYIRMQSQLVITCKTHGDFKLGAMYHLKGSGCPKCSLPKGEQIILDWLTNNNIEFVHQKTFPNCKHKRLLKFDFYIPHINMCIEFDGSQHFLPSESWGGEVTLKNVQIRDEIKNKYCQDHGITMLRIPYTQINDIPIILKDNI